MDTTKARLIVTLAGMLGILLTVAAVLDTDNKFRLACIEAGKSVVSGDCIDPTTSK